ncbi:CYTH domain-containing protein [Candidatus Parcubacteria bacterium]|nr:CYTH domain-containing protein [Patescibacteria group bacterium]MBU4309324.1 CYTH domain-containing protein [Patescibacteria group bacterium]MBU4432301.1 CYTH domain-containing protein [Patescibacteria group bacterium]MBU4577685.1 CYTH domain-containing protein [Patescibacteria group bacterium]MCG2697371.1 CYTH domain-containing protein [Candidatus Parcubacteria bacterium]
MNIEYEATYTNVDKDEVREKLQEAGAKLVKKEFMQKRAVFKLPEGNHINGGWLRVRDEGDRITMSLKVVDGNKIHNQKETMLTVDNFEEAKKFLAGIGCKEKAYQESMRELWELDGVDITIDEWPFLEPFVEVEGQSTEQVMKVSEKIGFNYNQAKFCSVDTLYSEKYNISTNRVNMETPQILFEMINPFI